MKKQLSLPVTMTASGPLRTRTSLRAGALLRPGIVSEGQGYGVVSEGQGYGVVSEGQGYGLRG